MDQTEHTTDSEAPPAASPQTSPGPAPKPRETTWQTIRSFALIILAVLCFRSLIAEPTQVPTGSMERTILVGDHLVLDKLLYGPVIPLTDWKLPELRSVHRGDIVAFRYPVDPRQMYIKRVIGVGGDVIKIRDRQVYVNGKRQNEPYAIYRDAPVGLPFENNFPPPKSELRAIASNWEVNSTWAKTMGRYIHRDGLHVPKGHLFVMGDNREDSSDSRFWGFVPLRNVVGEPVVIYWSYKAPSSDWLANSWSHRLRFDGSIAEHFITRTRWSRIGRVF